MENTSLFPIFIYFSLSDSAVQDKPIDNSLPKYTHTGFEESDCLETGELGRIDSNGLEPSKCLLQRPDVREGQGRFAIRESGIQVFCGREEGTGLQGHAPLDGTK